MKTPAYMVTGLLWSMLTLNPLSAGGNPNYHRPMWSPRGDHLVFMSDKDGNWELYLLRMKDLRVKRLTHDPAFDGYATWSPKGDQLVYGSDGNLILLALGSGKTFNLSKENGKPEGKSDFSADWSPDGQHIVFASDRSGDRDLYTMAPNGTGCRLLFSHKGSDGDPVFSPDGKHIAFTSQRNDHFSLALIEGDGSGYEVLVTDQGRMYGPAWSPDGKALVYNSLSGEKDLYLIRLGDNLPRRLTHHPGLDHLAVFMPGGKEIMFTREDGDQERIYTLELSSLRTKVFPHPHAW